MSVPFARNHSRDTILASHPSISASYPSILATSIHLSKIHTSRPHFHNPYVPASYPSILASYVSILSVHLGYIRPSGPHHSSFSPQKSEREEKHFPPDCHLLWCLWHINAKKAGKKKMPVEFARRHTLEERWSYVQRPVSKTLSIVKEKLPSHKHELSVSVCLSVCPIIVLLLTLTSFL